MLKQNQKKSYCLKCNYLFGLLVQGKDNYVNLPFMLSIQNKNGYLLLKKKNL